MSTACSKLPAGSCAPWQLPLDRPAESQRRDELAIQLLAMTRSDGPAGRVSSVLGGRREATPKPLL